MVLEKTIKIYTAGTSICQIITLLPGLQILNEEINCIIPKFVINYEFQEIKHHYYQIVNRLVDGCHQFLVYKHQFFIMENMFNSLCCKKELLHTYIGLIIVSYSVGSVFIAEALAVKTGLLEAINLGLRTQTIWSDSQSLSTTISSRSKSVKAQGVLFDIEHLCNFFSAVYFHHVPRLNNVKADALAKFALLNPPNIV